MSADKRIRVSEERREQLHELKDVGESYDDALQDAGVSVEHTNYNGMIHDFANMCQLSEPFDGIEKADDVLERAGESLRNAFED